MDGFIHARVPALPCQRVSPAAPDSYSLERRCEQKPRSEKPYLHGRDTQMKLLSCFLSAKLLDVAKDQYLPVFGGKANDSAANQLCRFNAGDSMMRQFARRGKYVEIVGGLINRSTALTATVLERFVDGHPSHPCAEAGFRTECRKVPPDFQEDFLQQVIRVSCVPHYGANASPYHRQVTIHQDRKALDLSRQSEFDKGTVFTRYQRRRHIPSIQ
jgi:hypothetical protein